MKRISLALLFTFALLGFMKGENLSVTTETVYFSYKQNIQIGIGDERLYLPGNTEAFPGYVVCGIEQTNANWGNYYFSTTFKHYLLPAEDKDKIEYLYSDTEYSVGDKIDGKTILARSVAFNLLFSPSENSAAMQANNFFHYSPQGMVNTTGDFYNYTNGDSDPKVHVDGAYIYKYCVEKLTDYCKIAEGEYFFVQGSEYGFETMYDAGGGAFTHTSIDYSTATDKYLWIVTAAGNGGYYIRNRATGLYLSSKVSTHSSRSLATKEAPEEFFFTVYESSDSKKTNYWIQSQEMIDREEAMDAAGNNDEVISWTKGDDNNTSSWELVPNFGWEYDSDSKTLYINSDAVMLDYENTEARPWHYIAEQPNYVVFATGITKIGKNTFYNFTSLNNITIPETVTSIGDRAFYNCWNLTAITCEAKTPPTLKNSYVFSGVNKSIPLYVPAGSVEAYKAAQYWSEFTNILAISSSDIASGTCGDNLTWRVTEEYELIIEGTGAMYDFSSGSAPWYEYHESIKAVTINEGVTSIGDYAFGYCTSLTAINIPEGSQLTSIGTRAFYWCWNLTAITIPESVTSIGDDAFLGCSSLTSITIPEGVTSIGSSAFSSCSSLTAIVLPKNLNNVGSRAFANCPELHDVYCYAEKVPSADSGAFADFYPEYATLHVPASALDAYKSTEPWSSFGTIVSLTDEEMSIENPEIRNHKSEITFDLRGRRVEKAEKGIYIVNGKKTVIK